MRIYFDENFSPRLIEGICAFQSGQAQEEVTVLSVKAEFGRGTADEDWIPQVGANNGVVVTQDHNLQRVRLQRQLCESHGLGLVVLKPPKRGWSYWRIIQVVVRWWPDIIHLAKEKKKPFTVVIEDRTTCLSTFNG